MAQLGKTLVARSYDPPGAAARRSEGHTVRRPAFIGLAGVYLALLAPRARPPGHSTTHPRLLHHNAFSPLKKPVPASLRPLHAPDRTPQPPGHTQFPPPTPTPAPLTQLAVHAHHLFLSCHPPTRNTLVPRTSRLPTDHIPYPSTTFHRPGRRKPCHTATVAAPAYPPHNRQETDPTLHIPHSAQLSHPTSIPLSLHLQPFCHF
ncbi:hypothetical protein Q7P37_005772 [Cladosporium fusiforme]